MSISRDLIFRFFQGQCTQAEAEAVLQYLEENPDAAEEYSGKKEWDETQFSEDLLPEARSKLILEKIRSKTYRAPFIRRVRQSWAVAACMTLILATGLLVYKTREDISGVTAPMSHTNWKTLENPADSVVDVILKDGSLVRLASGSQISFQVPFPADKRTVRLRGKAFFKVSKDSERPFTVYSGNVSTTALGTAFTIDAFATDNTISIKLHEGRVMVRDLHSKAGSNEYYLLPNQELRYSNTSGKVQIQVFADAPSVGLKQAKGRPLRARQTGVAISFDREPVTSVFEKLEDAYHTRLDYPKEGLKDYFFTGQFDDTDSLERVLRIIGETNKLEIKKTKSGYKINKKH